MSRIYTLFNKIITAIKGKAAAEHTHPYAGSAEAGGAANSVAHNLIAGSKKFDGSKDVTITASDLGDFDSFGAAPKEHTHDHLVKVLWKDTGAPENPMVSEVQLGMAVDAQDGYEMNGNKVRGFIALTNDQHADLGLNFIYDTAHKPTPSDIGAAEAKHTHPYAGSAEAGGAANSVAHNLIAGSKKFDGSKDVTITAADLGANYAAMTSEEAIAGTSTTNKVISAKVLDSAIDAAIEALPEPMLFKGSLGTDGTITALPAAAAANTGFTYKVITAGTYAEQKAKVGDTFISDGKSWILIPSGDEPSGTVTSVAIKATSPIAVDNDAAVTTSGTRTISHAASGVTAAAKGDTTNQAPAFGGTFKVPSGTVNATGHLTAFADHTVTIPSATATGDAPGLMSAADKTKLDGIAGGATASKLYGSTGTATDGAMTQKATTDALAGKAAAEHTHTAEEVGAAAASHNHDSVYVKKAGDTVTGTLVLSKTTDASGTANNSPALIVGGTADTAHIEIDNNEILAKSNGTTPAALNVNTDGGLVNMGGDLQLSGAEKHIRFNDGAEGGFNGAAISFYKGNANGAGVVIGAGGRTIIGGGEAARNLRTELNKDGSITDSSELTYIAADAQVLIDTNCQTIANRKQFTFQKDGRLSGVATPTADTDAANKKYVDDRVTAAAGSGGGVADSVAHNLIAGDKTYNGSADVTLTAADVGAAPASHTHSKFGAQKVSDGQNLDDYHGESYIGFYYAGEGNTVTGGPAGTSAFGLLVARSAEGQFIQVYWTADGTEWRRIYLSTGAWSAWWKVYDTGHKPTASDVGALAVDGKAKSAAAADAVPWSGVTGKPTIPSAYTLPAATSTALGGVKSGGDITVGTDGTVTVGHATKADTATSAASATKASSADAVPWSGVTSKPTIPAAANNATLTINQGGVKKGTFTANASSDVTINLTDTTYSDATTSTHGLMTAADKTKLNGLTTYSEATTSQSGLMSASDKSKLNGLNASNYMTKSNPTGTGTLQMNAKGSAGANSVAVGLQCTSSGAYSTAEGHQTIASGEASHAEGFLTTAAGNGQHVGGVGNVIENQGRDLFILGNGTLQEKTSLPGQYYLTGTSNAFRVTTAGAVIGKSAYQSTGADYAEMREWEDGNPNDEDRRGLFVTIHDDLISIAEPGDFIEGIVSGHPCVIGNFDEAWQGEFLRDEFNDYIMEDVEVYDPDTKGKKTVKWYKVNPDYDKDQPYIQREDRPEWDAVGMMGHLRVKDDGTCEPNGYCINTMGGIATKAEKGYRVVKRITENVVEIVFSMYANF